LHRRPHRRHPLDLAPRPPPLLRRLVLSHYRCVGARPGSPRARTASCSCAAPSCPCGAWSCPTSPTTRSAPPVSRSPAPSADPVAARAGGQPEADLFAEDLVAELGGDALGRSDTRASLANLPAVR